MVEDVFKQFAVYVALGCDFLAVLCVAIGAIQATVSTAPAILRNAGGGYAGIWRSFAVWLALALEFALAADIAETAIAPTWDEIGQLAAIAAIRTALNYFLERDLEVVGEIAAPKGKAKRAAPREEQTD